MVTTTPTPFVNTRVKENINRKKPISIKDPMFKQPEAEVGRAKTSIQTIKMRVIRENQ